MSLSEDEESYASECGDDRVYVDVYMVDAESTRGSVAEGRWGGSKYYEALFEFAWLWAVWDR